MPRLTARSTSRRMCGDSLARPEKISTSALALSSASLSADGVVRARRDVARRDPAADAGPLDDGAGRVRDRPVVMRVADEHVEAHGTGACQLVARLTNRKYSRQNGLFAGGNACPRSPRNKARAFATSAAKRDAYETIRVEKLTPIIGAEITGVDLGKLVSEQGSNRQMDEIHRALAENSVIFFRDQAITPQQHLAFGRKFGELHVHPAAPSAGEDPALMKIYADKNSPRANGEGLAHRRLVRRIPADGLDPLHPAVPAARRRHAVRLDVCGLRRALRPHEGVSGWPHRRS